MRDKESTRDCKYIHRMMSLLLTLLFVNSIMADITPIGDLEIERDKGVLVLNNENYESVLSNSPMLMIYFYDQKCSECHKMDIEFATAAWMMKETKTENQKPDFAKIDATLPSQLAMKHNVKQFPTMIFIKEIIMLNDQILFFSNFYNCKKSLSKKTVVLLHC